MTTVTVTADDIKHAIGGMGYGVIGLALRRAGFPGALVVGGRRKGTMDMHLPDGRHVELPQAAQFAELVSMGRVKRRDTGEVVKLEGMPHDVGRFAFLQPFQFVVPIEPTGEPEVMPCQTCTAPTPEPKPPDPFDGARCDMCGAPQFGEGGAIHTLACPTWDR